MGTVLTESGQRDIPQGDGANGELWLPTGDVAAATGWSLKPEGFRKGAGCVPIPAAGGDKFRRGDAVNVAALWHHMGKPARHSEGGDVWMLGESAADRSAALRSLEAPDFTLPDLQGRMHALSDYRGKKVFLVSWASW